MNKIRELIIKYKELIVYGIFGVGTTLVNLITFKLWNVILGDGYYLVSNIIAWFAAVIFAYITNKIWVFESKKWNGKVLLKEIPPFFASRVFTLLLEEAGLFLFVDLLKFNQFTLDVFALEFSGEMLAKFILAFVVVVLNYLFSKVFIFKKKK